MASINDNLFLWQIVYHYIMLNNRANFKIIIWDPDDFSKTPRSDRGDIVAEIGTPCGVTHIKIMCVKNSHVEVTMFTNKTIIIYASDPDFFDKIIKYLNMSTDKLNVWMSGQNLEASLGSVFQVAVGKSYTTLGIRG